MSFPDVPNAPSNRPPPVPPPAADAGRITLRDLSWLLGLGGGVAVVMSCLVVVAIWRFVGTVPGSTEVAAAPQEVPMLKASSPSELDGILEQAAEPVPEVAPVTPAPPAVRPSPTAARPNPSRPAAKAPTVPEVPARLARASDPLADLHAQGNALELPAFDLSVTAMAEWKRLAVLRGLAPQECTLDLVAPPADRNAVLSLEVADDATVPSRTWTVVKSVKDAFGTEVTATVGRFQLQDDGLSFQWNLTASPGSRPATLQFALLNVTAGGETATCTLSRPVAAESASLDFAGRQRVPLTLRPEATAEPASLQIEARLTGIQGDLTATLRPGEKQTLTLPDSGANPLELDVTFDASPTGPNELVLELFATHSAIRQTRASFTILPAQRVSWNSGKANVEKTRLRTLRAAVDKAVKRHASDQGRLTSQMQQLNPTSSGASTTTSSSSLTAAQQAQIEAVKRQLDAVAVEQDKTLAAQQELDAQEAWVEEVKTLLDGLRDRAQVEYAVRLSVGNQAAPIVRTRGFVQK